jgi:hypothetical protein
MTLQPTESSGSSFERVLSAVVGADLRHKVTKRGTHIQAECPTHADRTPSLSIDLMPDGKTNLKCQAGCGIDEVLAALELSFPMLFDNYEDPDTFAARRAREREEERRSGRRSSTARPQRRPVEKPRPVERQPARTLRQAQTLCLTFWG